ncbi:MAG: TIGR03960 family B12-binding radical SAM protein [Ignavibacteriales bacterium]
MFESELDKILPFVTKPARYTGNELNSIRKSWGDAAAKMAFAFPDVYEVGMSHLGGKILYGLVNERSSHLMERVFAPWPDMEEKMRREEIPLYSLESFTPMNAFDVVGFSLQYELSYSNVLNMLDLGGIPVKAADRSDDDPLIIAGGPNTYNPEPMVDFIDVFVIGEGEDVMIKILDVVHEQRGQERIARLRALSAIPGVYVPRLYEVSYHPDGTIQNILPASPEIPLKVSKLVVKDLENAYFPEKPIVPYLGVIHDRATLEIMRGCQRGCRFCQAGVIYRPVRERSVKKLEETARRTIAATGFDEISLSSLSSADYCGIGKLTKSLVDEHGPKGTGIALPSLRVDAFSVGLAQEVQRVRKTTLTFAPEAGSQRLRDVINKNISEEEIITACGAAFKAGWQAVKLYFMLGLPTETEEDLDGIIDLVRKIKKVGHENSRRPPKINVSLSFFVPKPHTPFQWFGQITREEMIQKKNHILQNGRIKNVNYDFHDASTSFLEAIVARGDRRLGQAIFTAWEAGAKFDGWREYFNLDTYLRALEACDLDPSFYANRARKPDEVLPWDFIDSGLTKEFLLEENERANRRELTPDCRESECQNCGICPGMEIDLDLKGGE